MSKKEKVAILRSDDFEVVDEALSDALSDLESTNIRIKELLDQQISTPEEEEAAGEAVAAESPAAAPDTKEDGGNDA